MNQPVSGHTRLTHLDSLRGFALLGILLVNFPAFSRPLLDIFASMGPGNEVDNIFSLAVAVLAQGKFYPLFSILFGAGFALIAERSKSRHLYHRRLLILALIGAIHGVFIWSGDILLSYAVVGLVLSLTCRRLSAGSLTALAITLLVLGPTVISTAVVVFLMISQLGPDWMLAMFEGNASSGIAADAAVYQSGSYPSAVLLRVRELGMMWSMAWYWAPQVLAYFMLGAALIRSGRLRDPEQHAGFFRKLACFALPCGLILSYLAYAPVSDGSHDLLAAAWMLLGGIGYIAAPPLLTFGYLGAFILLRQQLRWLAPAGRMALTLYLMQSLFWTLVFYGYGLGLNLPAPGVQVLLCLAFFAAQVLIAHAWFRQFRFGPMEWLWRRLTYRQSLALKHNGEQQ